MRVFYKQSEDWEFGERYYGCVLRTGRRTFLTESYGYQYGGGGPALFRLRGTLVGYAYDQAGAGGCTTAAAAVDLRTGASKAKYQAEDNGGCRMNAGLVLARDGSLGVIERFGGSYTSVGTYTYTVKLVTTAGAADLDSGEDIELGSLAIGGRWLYWTRGGGPRSARLP